MAAFSPCGGVVVTLGCMIAALSEHGKTTAILQDGAIEDRMSTGCWDKRGGDGAGFFYQRSTLAYRTWVATVPTGRSTNSIIPSTMLLRAGSLATFLPAK